MQYEKGVVCLLLPGPAAQRFALLGKAAGEGVNLCSETFSSLQWTVKKVSTQRQVAVQAEIQQYEFLGQSVGEPVYPSLTHPCLFLESASTARVAGNLVIHLARSCRSPAGG